MSLIRATENGNILRIRELLDSGANPNSSDNYGITALMNSGDGPTNGFAYYLGVNHNVPHGLAGAIFLKEVMNFNISNKYNQYEKLYPNMDSIELMNNFEKLYKNLNIPNLSTYGFTANDLDEFVSESII